MPEQKRVEQAGGLPERLMRDPREIERMRQMVDAGEDRPVVMLNCNTYTPEAGFPDGELYKQYMRGLEALVAGMGGRILWRGLVEGQPVGNGPKADEILAIWYRSHQAYLDLPSAPGGSENYRLRRLCVADAVIHAVPGDDSVRGCQANGPG